jgi:hypothetical protein
VRREAGIQGPLPLMNSAVGRLVFDVPLAAPAIKHWLWSSALTEDSEPNDFELDCHALGRSGRCLCNDSRDGMLESRCIKVLGIESRVV